MIQKTVSFQNDEGQSLSGVLRIPNDEGKYACLIICHGFLENKDRDLIVDLANSLSYEEFITLRFDFLFHGESHGSLDETTLSQQVDDIKDALAFLETIPQADMDRIGLIGHDLGGNACLLLEDPRVKAIATIGVRAHLDKFFQSYLSDYEMKEWLKRGVVDTAGIRLKDTFYYDMKKHDMLEAVQRKSIPLLFFHGTADMRHPFEDARALYKHAQQPTLEIIEEADHTFRFPDHRRYLIESIRNFFIRIFMRKRFERG